MAKQRVAAQAHLDHIERIYYECRDHRRAACCNCPLPQIKGLLISRHFASNERGAAGKGGLEPKPAGMPHSPCRASQPAMATAAQ